MIEHIKWQPPIYGILFIEASSMSVHDYLKIHCWRNDNIKMA